MLAASGTLDGSVWLDLFAGTGAVGIEAISRGAEQVLFVESERKHARLLRQNLQSLKISGGYELQEREVAQALPLLEAYPETCDFCFLDTPCRMRGAYERTWSSSAIHACWVHPQSWSQSTKKFDLAESFGALMRYRRILQGDAALSFYRLRPVVE